MCPTMAVYAERPDCPSTVMGDAPGVEDGVVRTRLFARHFVNTDRERASSTTWALREQIRHTRATLASSRMRRTSYLVRGRARRGEIGTYHSPTVQS